MECCDGDDACQCLPDEKGVHTSELVLLAERLPLQWLPPAAGATMALAAAECRGLRVGEATGLGELMGLGN